MRERTARAGRKATQQDILRYLASSKAGTRSSDHVILATSMVWMHWEKPVTLVVSWVEVVQIQTQKMN